MSAVQNLPAAPSREAIVSIARLNKSFGSFHVLKDIDLEVGRGEVLVIIGASGSGKSTLIRCVNGLEMYQSGRLTVDGFHMPTQADREIGGDRQLAEIRRGVGMVFQQFNLFPHLSALENVMLAQMQTLKRSRSAARERALQELRHVGLEAQADKKPAQCSGGQQQRIAIARSLAMDPKLMLFDEPTSALDPELGVEVLNTMKRLADEGMTMIVVTHEMHFAEEVSDEVVFMADGRILERGPASTVMDNPSSDRAKRFFSAVRGR